MYYPIIMPLIPLLWWIENRAGGRLRRSGKRDEIKRNGGPSGLMEVAWKNDNFFSVNGCINIESCMLRRMEGCATLFEGAVLEGQARACAGRIKDIRRGAKRGWIRAVCVFL